MAKDASSAFANCSGLAQILSGLDGRGCPSVKPMAKKVKAKAKSRSCGLRKKPIGKKTKAKPKAGGKGKSSASAAPASAVTASSAASASAAPASAPPQQQLLAISLKSLLFLALGSVRTAGLMTRLSGWLRRRGCRKEKDLQEGL